MKRSTPWRVALLFGAVAFVAALATLGPLRLAGVLAAGGDEPPIRVRNGSLHFELAAPKTWTQDDDDDDGGQTWTPSDGESKGKYVVDFRDGGCKGSTQKGRFVVIKLSDGTSLVLGTARSKKLKKDKSMLPSDLLTANGATLDLAGARAVSITVGWHKACDGFTQPAGGQKTDVACISSSGKSQACPTDAASAQ